MCVCVYIFFQSLKMQLFVTDTNTPIVLSYFIAIKLFLFGKNIYL